MTHSCQDLDEVYIQLLFISLSIEFIKDVFHLLAPVSGPLILLLGQRITLYEIYLDDIFM